VPYVKKNKKDIAFDPKKTSASGLRKREKKKEGQSPSIQRALGKKKGLQPPSSKQEKKKKRRK